MACIKPRIMDVDMEPESTDESDIEYDLPSTKSRGLCIQELRNQIEVARYLHFYKKFSEDYRTNIFSAKSPGVQISTKTVQTEPDTSGVPPSWFSSAQELANEVYTDIGNVINLYYTADGHSRKPDAFGSMENKYFRYENGYYQSTLLPNIKISAREVATPPISKCIKQKLNSLFEKARKLKYLIPENFETVKQVSLASSEEESADICKTVSDVIKQRNLTGTVPKLIEAALESEVPLSYIPPVACSSRYAESEYPEINSKKLAFNEFSAGVTKRSTINEKEHIEKNVKGSYAQFEDVCPLMKFLGSEFHGCTVDCQSRMQKDERRHGIAEKASNSAVPLATISKSYIPSRVFAKRTGRFASNREKNDKLHSINEGKGGHASDGPKNFVKLNILAVKAPTHTAGCSKSNYGPKSYAALKKVKQLNKRYEK